MAFVMILSDKSSGSTILLNELLKSHKANTIKYTRHFEKETLFWVKGAAVLGLPQENISYSEVPFEKDFAKNDLVHFISKNLPDFNFGTLDKITIFRAWSRLCEAFGPIFIEKSPHHLHVWSALDLISDYLEYKGKEAKFIGIIRNPMDTLYSSWRRWGAFPEISQFDWLRAYKNMVTFKEQHPDRFLLIRYEDLVKNKMVIKRVSNFVGFGENEKIVRNLHAKSIGKWKKDRFFGFSLSPEVSKFANQFGYHGINSNPKLLWDVYKFFFAARMNCKHTLRKFAKDD